MEKRGVRSGETFECLLLKSDVSFLIQIGITWRAASFTDQKGMHVHVSFPPGTEVLETQTAAGMGLTLFALDDGHFFFMLRKPEAGRPVRTLENVIPDRFRAWFQERLPAPFGLGV